jgi:hypothetical protein
VRFLVSSTSASSGKFQSSSFTHASLVFALLRLLHANRLSKEARDRRGVGGHFAGTAKAIRRKASSRLAEGPVVASWYNKLEQAKEAQLHERSR